MSEVLIERRFEILVWRPRSGGRDAAALTDQLRLAGASAAIIEGEGGEALVEAFRRAADAVVVVGGAAEDVLTLAPLSAWLVWDLSSISTKTAMNALVSSPAFESALRRVDSVVGASPELRRLVEDLHFVGLPALGLAEALGSRNGRCAVIVGSGLGNMLNVTPMIRWLSETLGQRVSVYISGSFPQGVSLFADAPFVDFVYPDLTWSAGRSYATLISTPTAQHLEPFCTAARWIRQNKRFDFNLHGRFVPETLLNFYGLEELSPDVPRTEAELPPPFVRDVDYVRPAKGPIGIFNGIKEGVWAKRQWGGIGELAATLKRSGHKVTTFGLPEEYVQDTTDATGLSIRETIALMAKCRLFVGHDGGMIHLADAIGVPTLWIFGPTAITKNGPARAYARVIRVEQQCGPCNFRLDWYVCGTPVCTTSIAPAAVAATAEEMMGDIPLEPGPRLADETLLLDEMRSLDSDLTAPGALVRRVQLTPRLASQQAAVVAQMLRFGDYEGARGYVEGAFLDGVGGGVLLKGVAEALDYMLARRDAPPSTEVLQASVDELVSLGLGLQEARALLECLTFPLASGGRSAVAAQLLRRAFERTSGSLRNWVLRQYLQVLLLAEEGFDQSRLFEARALVFDDSKLLARLNAALSRLNSEDVAATILPAPAEASSKLVRTSSKKTLDLLAQCAGGAALIVCRSFDPLVKKPGYAGAAIHRLGRIFSIHGVSPYVVSMAAALTQSAWALRDSVQVINGSHNWSEKDWQRLIEAINPRLVLDVDRACPEAASAPLGKTPRLAVSTRGLWNANGLSTIVGDELQIGLRSDPPASGQKGAVLGLDDVIAQLPPAIEAGTQADPAGSKVLLLLNSPETLDLARYVVRRLPELVFTVVSDVSWRGVEPNVECLLRKQKADWNAVAEACGTLVQLSIGPADLSVEAWSFIQQGKGCVVSSPLAGAIGALAPKDPASREAWVEAIRASRYGRGL
jgi:hypothetical protein